MSGAPLPTWYHGTAAPLPPFPALEGDETADVVVIGGGLTGLSAALVLAERGMSVVLLEQSRIGLGASGRNGGQFHSGHRLDQWSLEKLVGVEDAHRLWHMAEDAKGWLRTRIRRHAIDCDMRTGLVHADHKRRFVADSARYVEHLARNYAYPSAEALDRSAIRQHVRGEGYFGGWIDRDAGHLNPLKLTYGFARAAAKAGVRLHERSRAARLVPGKRLTVRTAQGGVTARFAVIGGDAAVPGLTPSLDAVILPIASTVAVTEPLGELLDAAIPGRVAVSDSRFVVNYFRPVDGGRLLFGGGESYSTRPVANPAGLVRSAMTAVFPRLENATFVSAWSGIVGITRTRLPFVRRADGNVLVAAGFSGQGVLLAPFFGALLAECVLGHEGRVDLLSRLPVPAFPGGAWLKRPMLVAAMSYLALRDRLA